MKCRKIVEIPLSSYKRLVCINARIEMIRGEDVPMGKVVAFLIEKHQERMPQDGELPPYDESVYAGYF